MISTLTLPTKSHQVECLLSSSTKTTLIFSLLSRLPHCVCHNPVTLNVQGLFAAPKMASTTHHTFSYYQWVYFLIKRSTYKIITNGYISLYHFIARALKSVLQLITRPMDWSGVQFHLLAQFTLFGGGAWPYLLGY